MVTDITGNGFDIYYRASLNPDLKGLTYDLENGGKLAPVPTTVPRTHNLVSARHRNDRVGSVQNAV